MSKAVLFSCLQALLIQGFSAQCIGAYNGYAAEAWPANPLAWENDMAWAANGLALESMAALGPAPRCGSAYAATSPYYGAPFAPEFGAAYSPASLSASNGGGFAVTSASPIAPTGVSMTSENAYEGPLAVSGAIPFLGAVALEGVLPTGGAGSVSYGCGNGNVAMINEDYAGYGIGPGVAGPAYGFNGLAGPMAVEAGLAGPEFGYNVNRARLGGCGCGGVY